VLRCALAQGPVDQEGALLFLPKTFFLKIYLIYRNNLNIPKFPEHVCLTACVGIPGLPPSGPK
jgi:hypothetical protein